MSNDKQQEYLIDERNIEELSECCGAPIIMTTFCKSCMEHCK